MQRRTVSAITIGAALGGVIALSVLALSAARVIESGVSLATDGQPIFQVGEGAMDLLIVIAGALSGALLGAIAYAIGNEAAPDSPRVSLTPLLILGAVIGTVIGFGVARAALGIAADRNAEIATISIFRAAMVALTSGAVTGALIGLTVERLSRPEAFSFGGEAWPTSPVEFSRDALRAMGLPALGMVLTVAIVFGISRVLLDASKEVGLIVFGGLSAVVLFGAAFVASHPPRGDE